MNTIYWLAVFVAFCGIGRFALAWLGLWIVSKTGNIVEQTVLQHNGIASFLPFKSLMLGIAAIIVVLTISH